MYRISIIKIRRSCDCLFFTKTISILEWLLDISWSYILYTKSHIIAQDSFYFHGIFLIQIIPWSLFPLLFGGVQAAAGDCLLIGILEKGIFTIHILSLHNEIE